MTCLAGKTTMEELLATLPQKLITLYRGQQVEGEVVAILPSEIILDLGTKSEGIIPTRDIPKDQLDTLKPGDKLKAFVSASENESHQVALALHPPTARGGTRDVRLPQNKVLRGRVIEVNRGGLMVDVLGTRGFLPNSQVGFELLSKSKGGLESLIGQDISVTVIEIDQASNRLIFSQRAKVQDELLELLKAFKNGQKVKGDIVAILPFGLVVSVGGTEGLIFISDISWDRLEDLSGLFKTGQEIEALVLGVDESLGRLNLSIKHLQEDPFTAAGQKFSPDSSVKGEVAAVSDAGVSFKLEDDVEGFLPLSKMDPALKYEVGKTFTLLVDSIDARRRKINLTPLVTSTAGLIYK
ncbi:30S ribosomal protein S1 [Candidatus Daviesbacteria bacterium]|nr:30S ribosomal protein S1 [Candidatus Daviesbacteria bacterium]